MRDEEGETEKSVSIGREKSETIKKKCYAKNCMETHFLHRWITINVANTLHIVLRTVAHESKGRRAK